MGDLRWALLLCIVSQSFSSDIDAIRTGDDLEILQPRVRQTSFLEQLENRAGGDLLAAIETGEGAETEWKLGSTGKGFFGVFNQGANKLFVNPDGAVWAAAEKGYLARGEAESAAPPGKLDEGSYITSGAWQIGATSTGHWGIFKDQIPKFVITAEGQVWGAFEGGYFVKKDSETETEAKREAIPEHYALQDGTSVISGEWKVGETLGGHLAWYKGQSLKALLHSDGDIWGAEQEGYFAVKEESERASGPMLKAITTTVVDCQVGEWSAYVECDKRCDGGTQHRIRAISENPANGGATCPYLSQQRKCNTFGCSTDCTLGDWSPWDDCSKKCGGGMQTRIRTVLTYPSSRGLPCGTLKAERQCGLDKCGTNQCLRLTAAFNVNADRSDEVFFIAKQHTRDATSKGPLKSLWARWNLASGVVSEGPMSLDEGEFAGLAEPFKSFGIDGSSNRRTDSDKIRFFSSTTEMTGHDKEFAGQWLSWDLTEGSTEKGPYAVVDRPETDQLPAPFDVRIDAGVSIMPQNDTSYLFSNVLDDMARDDYAMILEWDYSSNKPVGDPVKVAAKWPELPAEFGIRIDTAVNKGRFGQEVYLFSQSKWLLWDLASASVLDGPYDLQHHHYFKPLAEALDICTGADLQGIGKDSLLYRALGDVTPRPKATVAKLIGADGASGYADSTVNEHGHGQTIAGKALVLTDVRFDNPSGLAIVGAGTSDAVAYVADTNNHAIRRIHLTTGNTTTIAGGGESVGFLDGVGAEAKFRYPRGVSVVRRDGTDTPGDVLYVADTGNDAVRRVFIPQHADEGTVLTVAGGGGKMCNKCQQFEDVLCTGCCQCAQGGFADGHGIGAHFNKPYDVSVLYNRTAVGITANEFVYVADRDNHAIRRVVVKPGVMKGDAAGQVITVAGGAKDEEQAPVAGFSDGFGSNALFNHPQSVSALRVTPPELQVPSYDSLYVADTLNKALRRVAIPLVSTGTLEHHVLTTGDSMLAEKEHLQAAQQQRAAVQSAEAEALEREQQEAAAAVAAEEAAVADEAALQPTSRALMQSPAIVSRYTITGGTAPKDSICTIPFTAGGVAYNDCTNVPDEAMGITGVGPTGWCPTGDPKQPLWGPCAPSGYEPRKCLLSSWSLWEPCAVTCGSGGKTGRSRTIIEQGDYGCNNLNETRTCNAFTCGATVTVAGGFASDGSARGFPDKHGLDTEYEPVSVSAMHTHGSDVVFLAGAANPTSVPPIRRADISHDSGAILNTVVGTYMGATSVGVLSPEGPSSEVYATTSDHNIGKIDLSLMIECQPFLVQALNHWESDEQKSGEMRRSQPIVLNLTTSGGHATQWTFMGYKKIKALKYQDFSTLEGEPWKGDVVKNVLCARETPVVQETELSFSTEECCVAKAGPNLIKPCGGEFPPCDVNIHAQVLDQWENAKSEVMNELIKL